MHTVMLQSMAIKLHPFPPIGHAKKHTSHQVCVCSSSPSLRFIPKYAAVAANKQQRHEEEERK